MLPTLGAGTGAPDRHRVDFRTTANPASRSDPTLPGNAAGRDLPSPDAGPLAGLPLTPDASAAQRTLEDCFATCLPSFPTLPSDASGARPGASSVTLQIPYDPGEFRRRLAAWIAARHTSPTAIPAAPIGEETDPAIAHRLSEDLRSALAAAVSIGLAHSAEILMLALSQHPLVRLAAVSHPYLLGTLLESTIKRWTDVADPDPRGLTGVRFEQKIAAALANWNHVQPALDAVPQPTLARCLKVVATAGISALRDLSERDTTRRLLQALPPEAFAGPDGSCRLTDMETLFVNGLMCWLRNVAVDLLRQIVRGASGPALPPVEGIAERFLRSAVLGSQVPGGLPAAAIASQAALADAVRAPRPARDDAPAAPALAYAFHNPF